MALLQPSSTVKLDFYPPRIDKIHRLFHKPIQKSLYFFFNNASTTVMLDMTKVRIQFYQTRISYNYPLLKRS